MTADTAEALALQRMYSWEKNEPDKVVFTQPYEGASRGGQVRTWTWRQAMDETRRVAAYLKGLNLPPRSHIALISKNTAFPALLAEMLFPIAIS